MQNKPKCRYPSARFLNATSKPLKDIPIPMDLSREINLTSFNIKSKKQERISEYMCRNIRKTKLKALKRSAKIDVGPTIPRPSSGVDFKSFLEKCPITDMSRFLEKSIRCKINAQVLEKRFPHILNEIMKDTKAEYKRVTHYAGINLKIKEKFGEDFTIRNYKFLGKTENYDKFLCIKKQFGMRWVLHYSIMRIFLKGCVVGLPYQLFEIEITNVIDLDDLRHIFREKINSCSITFHDFHKKMNLLFDKPDTAYKKKPSMFLPACTKLFSIYVSKCIAHTMESIVEYTKSVDKPPYLNLYVDFNENLDLAPTEEEVIQIFHKLLDDIISTGEDLYVMEKGRLKGCESKKIFLCLTEEFIQDCKTKIRNNIGELYEPILNFLENLGSDFREIYSDINSNKFASAMDTLFEDGCKKIQYYKKFLHKVAYIPNKEYFKIGHLDLLLYREKLYSSLQLISESIFKNLASQHLWEINDICESFKLIKIRASTKPITTEELIEIGKFMTWVKNEQLEDLNQRVYDALKSLCNIITLGILEEDHMKKNSAAMNWIDDIKPIIEQHSTVYEQLKFEAEEKLQKVIEEINVLIVDMHPLLVILDEMDNIKLARKYLSQITLHMTKIKEIHMKIDWINSEEVCLNFPKSSYVDFENLKDYVYPFYHLLKLSLDVQKNVSVWQYGQFDLLEYDSAQQTVQKFCKELIEIQKYYRKKLRQAQDENLPIRFKGTVDDPDILNWPAPLKLCGMSINVLEEFKPSLTIMQIMCNKALRPRHWKAMSEIAGFNLMPNAGTTLKKIMEYDLQDKLYEYEIISTCATKEQQLLDHLNSLKNEWEKVCFQISNFTTNISILIGLGDVQTIVDDHIIKILSMRSSVFVKPYELDVLEFYDTLLKVASVINDWTVLQTGYLQLFSIFSLPDVIKNIPKEERQFRECDFIFKKYATVISENPRVLDVVSKTNIVDDVKGSLVTLEEVHHGLDAYLELFRLRCPRLYLISNEELINVMATTDGLNNPTFINRIFPGIIKFIYSSEDHITGFLSPHGEEVTLKTPIQLSNKSLDAIINECISEIRHTIMYLAASCYKIFKRTLINDLLKKFPQQSLQLMAKVFWTDQVENALKLSHNIKLLIYKKKLEDNIQQKMNILNENSTTHLQKVVLKNLILTDLNNKYLLTLFVKDGVVIDHNHFDWQVQLRYYFQKSLNTIHILKYTLNYGYEYLGNSEQIVLTPLTSKCFITILHSFFLNYFGFIKGEDQAGKFITSKSLADALGKLFFAVNCISQLSFRAIIKILKATVLSGAWLCLRNIDLLRQEIVSAISQELFHILECKKLEVNAIKLNGEQLIFDNSCFVLVQVGNEVELPENFKVMFRTFTLFQPDVETIVEGWLISEGIGDCKTYAKKIQQTFALLRDVIKVENQFTFNLREAKRVLEIFKKQKRINEKENILTLICESFRQTYAAGLFQADLEMFENTLESLFVGYNRASSLDKHNVLPTLMACNVNLSFQENFTNKVLELYECLKSSRGIILLGNTFTGKTTVLKLCKTLFKSIQDVDVDCHVINPKYMTYNHLVGKLSRDRNVTWTDGILLKIFRESQKFKGTTNTWVLFDGYLDESWTKDLICTLESGNLILETLEMLMPETKIPLIFECTSLDNSSPAMVSRCSTIYFSSETLSTECLIDAWLKSCNSDWFSEHKGQIEALFKWFIPACFETLKILTLICNIDNIVLIKNILIYFQLILDDACSKVNKKEEDPKNISSWIHATFVLAGLFGFSNVLSNSARLKFDTFYKQLWRGQHENYPYPCSLERLEVGIPSEGLLFDYCYLYKQRGTWKQWSDLLKNEKIISTEYLTTNIVPSVDTMRCNYLLDLHIKYNKHFLVIGPKSTGKSMALKDCYINRLPETKFEKTLLTFSKSLTAENLQKLILSKLSKKKSGHYSSTSSNRFICFIDDLQYTLKDEYEISSVLELLRQHLDHHMWHDLKSLDKIVLENLTFVAAATTSKLDKLSVRCIRHFNSFGMGEFSSDIISKLYSQNLMQTWKKSGFPSDMLTIVTQMVNATLKIYNHIVHNMKATLDKCHYIFDLSSFSRVIYGCTFLKKETYDINKKIHIKMWVHEVFRVFGDRFSRVDIKSLVSCVKEALKEYFSEELNDIFANFEEEFPFSKIFFGTFQDKDLSTFARHYQEVNFQQLKELCIQGLQEYNSKSEQKLDLLFFDYALEKLARICRLLSMPNENALFLGVTGCGRESLTKLASFLYKHKVYQPIITSSYDEQTWCKDFMLVLKQCGGLNNKCVLLVAEEQIIDESFFNIIDYYIREGEIIDLYDIDEKQDILELSRLAAQGGNRNLDISSHKVFLYFNKKCRENFHLFLSLNSNANNLRRRILQHPSLATRLAIILWKDWQDSTLRCVSRELIHDVNLTADVKEETIAAAIFFHRTCQLKGAENMFVTPKSFIHLNKIFIKLITKKQQQLLLKISKFQKGLAKLSFAATQIFNMQDALAEYQPQLEEMTKNAIEMTEQIALETAEVEKASALVRKDEKIAGGQAAVAQILKSECESELAQAIPILEDAISALNTLKPSDITLVKSMKNPPDAIKLVMASVCVIKDVKPDKIPDPSTGRKSYDYWGPSKRILGDMNFLQSLKDFDKDHIRPEIMVKIRKEYLPHKDFKPHVVAKASSAAEGLCKWIIAMDMYDRVAKEVAPKKEKLNKAEREYAQTMSVLNEKKEEVVRIEEKLAQLHILLNEATQKQVKLQVEVDLCNRKLHSAQKLIGGLSGERQRWTEASENLQEHYNVLAGDILLSSAIIAYLPPLRKEERNKIVKLWMEYIADHSIPSTKDFDFTSVLSRDVETELWLEQGLPNDPFFIENAIMHQNSTYFSLFLDPHEQAFQWIVNVEGEQNLLVTKFTYKNWLEDLKYCITNGKPILIKDIKGEMPSCLNMLIYRQSITKDGVTYLSLDEEMIKMHPNTKVYVICCQPELRYSWELRSRVTVINFSLTSKALKEDVLKTIVEIENPQIRKLTRQLIKWNKETKGELKHLEMKILNTLCESDADILEDEQSILILDQSRELTLVAREKQETTNIMSKNIQELKEKYDRVAEHVASLFFCVDDLRKLNNVYQFSLKWFKDIYFASILNAGKSRDFNVRCQNLCNTFTADLHKSVSKGLYEKHKLLFAFWLSIGIAVTRGDMKREEIEFFFKLGELYETSSLASKPEWISKKTWRDLQQLEQFSPFKGITDSIAEHQTVWKDFSGSQTTELPSLWDVPHFQKLMLIKVLKPDKLHSEILNYIKLFLGDKMSAPSILDMQEIYNESYSLFPVIFIVTPGVDILKVLHDFASVKQVLHKFHHLSLNQDNLALGEEIINKGQKEGFWVLLQNCQYTEKWLYRLEQHLEGMNFENTNENFRLFLTSSENHEFPLELMQNSIKIIDQPSNNIKKNLLRAYNMPPINLDDYFYGCPGQQVSFSKLVYSLCFFHFFLQKRQSIINWNITYRYQERDLLISLELLRVFVNEQSCLYEKIFYLIGECNYSGKLINTWEKQFVMEVLRSCINERMFEKHSRLFNGIKQYFFPRKNDRWDYLQHFNNLAEQEVPEVLYLTEHQLIMHDALKISSFLDYGQTILNKHVISRNEFRLLVIIDDLLAILPENIAFRGAVLDQFITREIFLYNNLIKTIKGSLRDLKSAFGGENMLTEQLEELAASLFRNEVPKAWLKLSFPTILNLSSFTANIAKNLPILQNYQVSQIKLYPGVFFFPQTVIANLKLAYAKQYKFPIEEIFLNSETFTNEDVEPEEYCIILNGLHLFGASYELMQNCIVELLPKMYYSSLPPIKLQPFVSKEKIRLSRDMYKCCIFKTQATVVKYNFLPTAQNFITKINLKCSSDYSFWLKRGVFIVCELCS